MKVKVSLTRIMDMSEKDYRELKEAAEVDGDFQYLFEVTELDCEGTVKIEKVKEKGLIDAKN